MKQSAKKTIVSSILVLALVVSIQNEDTSFLQYVLLFCGFTFSL